jgi:hypothetical protein
MIEFIDYRRDPLAPSPFVNKIGGICRVSPTLMKVTFVLATGNDGVEAASLLWEDHDLCEASRNTDWVLKEMRRGTFRIEDGVGLIRSH